MNASSRLWHIGLPLLISLSVGLLGCTSEKEKARKALEEAVQKCREAEVDGPYYEVDVVGGETDEVLALTCDEEITDFEMLDEFEARAMTGPTEWRVARDSETTVWVPMSAEWRDLKDALSSINESDPSQESLEYAENLLGEAQKTVPESSFIRLKRMENLLDLRAAERRDVKEEPWKLGDAAQSHFEETVSWARENDQLDLAVEARLMVVRNAQDYLDYLDQALDSLGSQDEWLEKSIKASEKQGDEEAAEATREELEQMREDRPRKREMIEGRKEATKAFLCEHVSKLSPAGVSDPQLKKMVISTKESIDCMKSADDAAGDDQAGE
ncbi:MAG: hypothetical protein ACQEVA_10555 [Myxococcota bacterium]